MASLETPREALANAIRVLVTSVERAGEIARWNFAVDSPAAVDWHRNEVLCGWGNQPLQDAYRTGAIGWYLLSDQALSVADLLDSGRAFGLLSASRSLAEAACRSAYLLAEDVDPTSRMCRMINERLYALFEYHRFVSEVPGADATWQQRAADDLIDAGASMNLPVRCRAERVAGWVGFKRAPTMEVLGDLIGHRDYAAGFYRDTSAVSHAALHGMPRRLEVQGGDQTEYRARVRQVDIGEVVADIQPAIAALAHTSRLLITQTGWQVPEWAAASDALERVTRTIISAPQLRPTPGEMR